MAAYYNENDPFAAAWLRELISAGHIADGEVDDRSISDVRSREVRAFTQCHFFAGIGVWSFSLRAAGWPDERPVWTGSCPCQPFSAAGQRGGEADERHLWPHWFHLIEERRPSTIFGEQVASKAGLGWFDLVSADMEAAGYAIGAADLCAAGVGAPHIRQRLFFIGQRLDDAAGARRNGARQGAEAEARDEARLRGPERRRGDGGLADADDARPQGRRIGRNGARQRAAGAGSVAGGLADAEHAERRSEREIFTEAYGRHRHRRGGATGGLADAEGFGRLGWADDGDEGRRQRPSGPAGADGGLADAGGAGAADGFWSDADWLCCRDGKFRPVESGTFPLASGIAGRVGRLRGYGNSLNAEVAKTFIETVMEII